MPGLPDTKPTIPWQMCPNIWLGKIQCQPDQEQRGEDADPGRVPGGQREAEGRCQVFDGVDRSQRVRRASPG